MGIGSVTLMSHTATAAAFSSAFASVGLARLGVIIAEVPMTSIIGVISTVLAGVLPTGEAAELTNVGILLAASRSDFHAAHWTNT